MSVEETDAARKAKEREACDAHLNDLRKHYRLLGDPLPDRVFTRRAIQDS